MPSRRLPPFLALSVLPLLLGACSSGGEEERPTSAVKLTSNHYLSGFVARPRFPAFPVTVNDVLTFDHRLELRDDGNYVRSDSQSSQVESAPYALEEDGTFSIQVPTGTQTLLYRGDLEIRSVQPPGSSETVLYGRDVFLTDRVGSGIGLYVGTQRVPGPADITPLVGDWHVFNIHAIFADSAAAPDDDRVGLAFAGTLTLAADGSFAGNGTESETGGINIRGAANDFQAFADGRVSLEILYDPTNKPDYERGFSGGGTRRLLFGVDGNFGGADQAAGLLAMMRFRTSAVSSADLAGKYTLGLLTLFLRPDASGTDSALGTIELTRDGNFLLQARNNLAQDFEYRGTFTPTDNGTLTFQVTTPFTETWYGSFDEEYQTVVLLDAFKEQRPNRQIELNFGVAIRPRNPL